MLRRTRLALAVIPLACALGPAALGAAAPAAAAAGPVTTICQEHHYRLVTGASGRRYAVENGNFGGRPECIRNVGLRPDFTVTRSGADSQGPEVDAYPFTLYGCSWGLCTPGTALPARVSRVRTASASWSFRTAAAGRWNAAFDVWFGRHRSAANGQARGAELMIWLNARDYPAVPSRAIRVDGRGWYVYHWVTSHDGAHWNYVQIRAVRPVTSVRQLALVPIIRRVEQMGLIRPSWWLLNIESGFEIWQGGTGLASTSFSADVSRR